MTQARIVVASKKRRDRLCGETSPARSYAGISRLGFFAISLSVFIWFAVVGLAQQSSSADSLANRIEALNQALASGSAAGTERNQLNDLLSRRAALMAELLSLDTARTIQLALLPDLAARLGAGNPGSAIESRGEWEGLLEQVVADDFKHQRSWTRWYVSSGTVRLEVFFSGKGPQRPGVKVRLTGLKIGVRVAVTSFVAEDTAAPLV